ncbi:hypothetical protein WJ14_02860 [Burkholderia cenocepacia]|nr:hypothetical protein WJ14_02860 [Burkholderia cenocepacia]
MIKSTFQLLHLAIGIFIIKKIVQSGLIEKKVFDTITRQTHNVRRKLLEFSAKQIKITINNKNGLPPALILILQLTFCGLNNFRTRPQRKNALQAYVAARGPT